MSMADPVVTSLPPRSLSRAPRGIRSNLSAKPRNTLHSIDTNLRSYDRTDPFAAFNVLLKLLGSLPSRIGGCQYKLSPDEHKLSMHLLAIVEPFVGAAHSKRTLTRQPTEILDAIAFHIDESRDLLNLALSCRRLHAIVCPRHLAYRVIRCKASAVRVWHHLTVHRALARNVRWLEVLDERTVSTPVVPEGIMVRDTDLESTDDELSMHAKQERFLVASLEKMSALKSFTWSCNHSPVSIDSIWPILSTCQTLQEVNIKDNRVFASSGEESQHAGAKLQWVLPELKNVALQSTKHTYGAPKHPDIARISGMLNHAPNIQSLTIAYPTPRTPIPRADTLLLLARYPALTSLTLTNLALGSAHPLAAFLAAHPQIEVLHLDLTGSAAKALSLPPGSLPRLRELKAPRDVAAGVLGATCTLETLKGITLGCSDERFLSALRAHGASIRRVELACGGWAELADVKRLVACTPSVHWLDVGPGRRSVGVTFGGKAVPVTNVAEWADVLGALPELVAFHGVKFFYEVSPATAAPAAGSIGAGAGMLGPSDRSRMRKNDEAAGVLGRRCVRLRRVDHWEEGGGRVVVLLREGGEKERGARVWWEVRRVKA